MRIDLIYFSLDFNRTITSCNTTFVILYFFKSGRMDLEVVFLLLFSIVKFKICI